MNSDTKKIRYQTGTEFGLWLRNQQELDSRRAKLSIQNLDYAIHRFEVLHTNEQRLFLLEEKRYNGLVNAFQADTHGIINQALTYANGMTVDTMRGKRRLHYLGYHILRFECTNPDDGKMYWNNTSITRDTLIKIVRCIVDPNSIKPNMPLGIEVKPLPIKRDEKPF